MFFVCEIVPVDARAVLMDAFDRLETHKTMNVVLEMMNFAFKLMN